VILVGDIGGTHARLAILGSGGRIARQAALESRQYASLEDAVAAFLGDKRRGAKVTRAAFGVAGPVVDNRCVATNLPWVVDGRAIARKLKMGRVTLLNDLVALALGALGVPRSKLHVLGDAGVPRKKGANVAVIAAGTGLGEAILVWDAVSGGRWVPSSTEGGHTDFAPGDDVQADLWRFLRATYGHVSWERVLSGNGLGNLYDFFRQAKGLPESTENAQTLGAATDRNALIAELGLARRSEPAARAVDLFATLYGAEAGNLALKALAVGGVYVCGNIAAHMVSVLDRGLFRKAFADKGRFGPMMDRIPVALVLDTDVGLAGAARVAGAG